MNIIYFMNKQAGVSLVEVMLACALGVFLMTGLMQTYLTVKKAFTLQQAIVNIQENARFTIHFLSQAIRMAGYAGCLPGPPFINQSLAIQGYQQNVPDFLAGRVKKGTDSLLIGYCREVNGKEQFAQYAFFISATSRKNRLGKTIYALYEAPMSGDKRELVADVEDMRINYGIVAEPSSSDIIRYIPAEQVMDWDLVRSVEIALLFTAAEPVYTKPVAYQFAGITWPAQRYLYKEWDMYVVLRGRQ